MLNKRQINIVSILYEKNNWITGKELSRIFSVSDRTIRQDISSINRYYNCDIILSNLRKGYHLDQDLLSKLDIQIDVDIPQTPRERCIYILQRLLIKEDGLNLTLLQDQIYVSGYSIDNDIKRIRKQLKKYPNLHLERSKNYLYLKGDESEKRKLYKKLLADETKGNFLNINKIASLYKDFDLLKVHNILEKTLDKYNYIIHDAALPMLLLHIGIGIERILQFNYVHTSRIDDDLKGSLEYKISTDFYNEVGKELHIEVIEDEIALLALLFLGKKSSHYTEGLITVNGHEIFIEKIVDEMLENLYQYFDVDFRADSELILGLTMHMQSLLERVESGISMENVFLQEIKRKYPLVFEMGIRSSIFIEEKLGVQLNQDEVGFIALHLGAANERINATKKIRAVMIIPNNVVFSKLCLEKIDRLYGDRLEIIESFTMFEKDKVNSLEPDLIITLVNLVHPLPILTVQISMFMNLEDESIIFQALNKIDKQKMKLEFNAWVEKLILEQFFYCDLQCENVAETISFMCSQLEEHNVIDHQYTKAVFKREEMSPTSFAYGFATPHALEVSSLKSVISIALMKEPIQWGDYQVKLVMLLAIKEEDIDFLRMFFDWLTNAINDVNQMTLLLLSKDYNEFMERILDE